jgi:hypothetical protein
MQVTGRQPESETDLTALYRRRKCVVLLIQWLERYQRALALPPQGCSRQAPRTAA